MVYICAAKNGGEKMLLSSERVDIITLFAKKNKKRNSKKIIIRHLLQPITQRDSCDIETLHLTSLMKFIMYRLLNAGDFNDSSTQIEVRFQKFRGLNDMLTVC